MYEGDIEMGMEFFETIALQGMHGSTDQDEAGAFGNAKPVMNHE